MVIRIKNKIKRILAEFIARESSYHFLIKDIKAINDLNLVQKILGLDLFMQQTKLVQPNLGHFRKILVLAPHQDDESIGAGGFLSIMKEKNCAIKVIFTTDGSQQSTGCSVEDSKEIRRLEAIQALKNITTDIEYLNISNLNPEFTIKILKELNNTIASFQPDIVLLPWLLDFPIKHRQLNHALFLANNLNKHSLFEIWSYQVHNSIFANVFVNITTMIKTKKEMLSCYRSQNEKFKRHDHLTIALNAWNSRLIPSTVESYVELFFTLPNHKYYELTETQYSQNLNEVYRNDSKLLANMVSLEQEIQSSQ